MDSSLGPVRLIVNTKSRRGQEWFEVVEKSLRDRGVEVESAHSFEKFDDLLAKVREGISRKVPLIACGGGDGTFSGVAREFIGAESVLGVLPLGTGNAFARDLGIQADVTQATDVLVSGKVVHVDLGQIGEDVFVNVATIGLTTRIARNLTDDDKKRFGRFVYAFALARGIRQVRPFRVKLTTDDGIREFETLQMVIGVGRYHAGPLPLSPEATITDGHLTVYALRSASKMDFLKMAALLPFGRQGDLQEVHSEECRSGKVETFPPVSVTVDGEVDARTPFEFKVLPGALRVMVPTEFAG